MPGPPRERTARFALLCRVCSARSRRKKKRTLYVLYITASRRLLLPPKLKRLWKNRQPSRYRKRCSLVVSNCSDSIRSLDDADSHYPFASSSSTSKSDLEIDSEVGVVE